MMKQHLFWVAQYNDNTEHHEQVDEFDNIDKSKLLNFGLKNNIDNKYYFFEYENGHFHINDNIYSIKLKDANGHKIITKPTDIVTLKRVEAKFLSDGTTKNEITTYYIGYKVNEIIVYLIIDKYAAPRFKVENGTLETLEFI